MLSITKDYLRSLVCLVLLLIITFFLSSAQLVLEVPSATFGTSRGHMCIHFDRVNRGLSINSHFSVLHQFRQLPLPHFPPVCELERVACGART